MSKFHVCSHLAILRRIENLGQNVFRTVVQELSRYFALAFDSSTYISSTAQLILCMKYCTQNNVIKEDFLKVLPMKGQTRAQDYLDILLFSVLKSK